MTNPFQRLYDSLSEEEQPITVSMLRDFADDIEETNGKVVLENYPDIFKILEFLETNGVVKITHLSDDTMTIKRAY